MTSLAFYPFPSGGKLPDHSKIKRDESQKMIIIYLRSDPMDALMQCDNTKGAYANFSYLKELYEQNLELVDDVDSDELQVTYHREFVLRCFLQFLVSTFMFVDKSETYVDVAYLRYFIDLSAIHKWNWEGACLIYLYSKWSEGSLWTTKVMTSSCPY